MLLNNKMISNLSNLYEKITNTSRRIQEGNSLPSDDPITYSKTSKFDNTINQLLAENKGIVLGKNRLDLKANVYEKVGTLLGDIKDIQITLSNDTNSPTNINTLNNKLDANVEIIKDLLLSKDENNNYLFSGGSLKSPFTMGPPTTILPKTATFTVSGIDIMSVLPQSTIAFLDDPYNKDTADAFFNDVKNNVATHGVKSSLLDLRHRYNNDLIVEFTSSKNELEPNLIDLNIELNNYQIALEYSLKVMSKSQKTLFDMI